MTQKQKRFVEEYLIDLNATQATIRAGYSPESARSIGSALLKKPDVKARLDKAMAERSKRTGVNQDRIIRELARVAMLNAPDVINLTDATLLADASEDDTAAIASVKVKKTSGNCESIEREVRFADKVKALELLGRHQGMFTDNVNMTATVPVQIINDIPKDDSNG